MAEKILTQKAITKYINSGGNLCPYCGSKNIVAGQIESCDEGPQQDISCDDCKREWTDVYSLADILEFPKESSKERTPGICRISAK